MSISSIWRKFGNERFRFLHLSIIMISIFALVVAYYAQHVIGLAPCPLCIYQRVPYAVLIKISLMSLIFARIEKYAIPAIALTLLCAICLSAYHSAIERGFIEASAHCTTFAKIPEKASIEDSIKMLMEAPIASCSKAAIKVLGVSMTEWNLLLNIFVLYVVAMVWREQKHAKT